MASLMREVLSFSLPPDVERERYTLKTFPLVFVAILPLFLGSYLRLRHPGLSLFVKLLVLLAGLPITSHFLLKRYFVAVWYDYYDGTPYSVNHLNFVCGMAIGFIALKYVEVLLLGKEEDFQVKATKEYRSHIDSQNQVGAASANYTIERPAFFPGTSVPLEIDMVITIRGQGYNWGLKESKAGYKALLESQQLASKPASVASWEKWLQVRRVGISAFINLMLMDICDSIIKDSRIFPAAGRIGGGSVEEALQGVFGRAGPMIVVVATGTIVFSALQGLYALGYFVHLLLTDPVRVPIVVSKWEPLPFYRPYAATSLASFWTTHWHAFIRRTFTISVYKPVRRLSGKAGLPVKFGQIIGTIAVFALSGFLHEGCLEGQKSHYYDRTLRDDYHHLNLAMASKQTQDEYGFGARHFTTTYAFTIQAFFVFIEDFWLSAVEPRLSSLIRGQSSSKMIHDGHLRNLLGWIWTMSCMVYSGYYLCDLWHMHGLTNSLCSLRITQKLNTFLLHHL